MLLIKYYAEWIDTYKRGAIRDATLKKYLTTLSWLEKIAPKIKLEEVTKPIYQRIINEYALCHEKQTVLDFHHQIKSALLDAIDEGLLEKDPTRRVVIKGKKPTQNKKPKYLNQFDLQLLIKDLNLEPPISMDWLILLTAKTGVRFSEALGITPADFDFARQTLTINKTWDYKNDGGFAETKNKSSVRKIPIDWQMSSQFAGLTKGLPENEPIFVKKGVKIYNSTVNDVLAKHCKRVGIEPIAIHGLRHTHASMLLAEGVTIASVSKRLGHSNMATTQKVYLHIIKELESRDTDAVMRALSSLNAM